MEKEEEKIQRNSSQSAAGLQRTYLTTSTVPSSFPQQISGPVIMTFSASGNVIRGPSHPLRTIKHSTAISQPQEVEIDPEITILKPWSPKAGKPQFNISSIAPKPVRKRKQPQTSASQTSRNEIPTKTYTSQADIQVMRRTQIVEAKGILLQPTKRMRRS